MRLSLFYQKAIVHLLALLPALWLFWQGWLLYDYQDHALTANPIQYINQYTGDWAIRLILLGLALTPLRQVFGWNRLIQFRRMNFMVLDHFFDWATIIKDVIKRPAITFGMIAATLLIPLAVTSTKGWVRRLGKKWIKLHQLIYIIGALAVVHNIMMVKADLREPLIHLGILIILLGYRLARRAGFTYSMT